MLNYDKVISNSCFLYFDFFNEVVFINKVHGRGLSLTSKIFIGLISGLVFGIALSFSPPSFFKHDIMINGLLPLAGGLFLRAIKMLVVPLVFISIVSGACAMGDINKLGRIGFKIMTYYILTTVFAISLALAVGSIINPGRGFDLSGADKVEISDIKSRPFTDTLLEIIPANPLKAMAGDEMLQVIFLALFTGLAMALSGEKSLPVVNFFNSANEIVMKMVIMVMHFAPYGVFALVAKTFATAGIEALIPILKFALGVLAAMLLHVIFIYGGMLFFIARLSPLRFFKKILPVAEVAFSTSSSNATLPFTIETAVDRLGVSKNAASFTLPLGATINMDGTAIMQGVAAIFIAQIYMIDLGMSAFLKIILTATLASIGTAGVPGVGMITLSMVLQSVGLPLEGIGLIIGVDRIIDMLRTCVNVAGDLACTIVVAKSENEFDETVFNSEENEEEAGV
jgi:Na+/H+-dicarboxylate symporter